MKCFAVIIQWRSCRLITKHVAEWLPAVILKVRVQHCAGTTAMRLMISPATDSSPKKRKRHGARVCSYDVPLPKSPTGLEPATSPFRKGRSIR